VTIAITIVNSSLIISLFVIVFGLSKKKNERVDALETLVDTQDRTENELMGKVRLLTSENKRLLGKVNELEADRDYWREEAVDLKKSLIRHGAVRG